MNIKLNQGHRNIIAKNARKTSPINKQLAELLEARYDIAEKIRIVSLGGIENSKMYEGAYNRLMKIRNSLPDNLITHDIGITVKSYTHLIMPPSRKTIMIEFKGPRICLNNKILMEEGGSLLKDLEESLELEGKYRKQLKDLEYKVFASISSITTVKKLLDSWPEVKELLPSELLQSKPMLPALQTGQLNSLIGLPTTKQGKLK
ncbi:MAG: Nmad5 family putative nucleotide modification protein [Acinetobacter sp.]|uniref:Nmad5 family putative nucleotide modification protein n=1 Tax=Acinetobacter sp. TaxID=472 RepID=UPI0026325FDE|nr:Nmad5 family putative nucleotide modification protein [Acinetobacter sp.]MDD2944936.1 Nmad5 family putative nucleotide modification protein [Acinetobacter sp.]